MNPPKLLERPKPKVFHQFTLNDLKIRTKDSRLIVLGENLKPIQKKYLSQLCPRWMYGETQIGALREINLKARQEGISTLIAAIFFLDTINNPLRYSAMVAHDEDSTQKLWAIVQRYYENLPVETRPRTKLANQEEYYWPDLDSYFCIGTAGTKDFGRGGTINNAHLSEVGMWGDAESLIAGLLQSVPLKGNAFVESTAKGFGNWFQEEWDRAESGKSNFKPRFHAWFEDPDYSIPVPEGFKRTAEEDLLAERYRVTDGQLAWLRIKAKELRDKLPQEYPANPTEAFLVSGTPYFNNAFLLKLRDECPEPIFGCNIRHYDDQAGQVLSEQLQLLKAGKLTYQPLEEDRFYDLELWELPKEDETYVIGGDPAEGLNPKGDPDSCSAIIIAMSTWTQVGHLRGRWNTNEFGMMLAHLGWFYNTALLAPERNTHGHAVINTILNLAKYPKAENMEARGLYIHEEYDEARKKKDDVKKPGWPTTARTKVFALDGLSNDLLDRTLIPRSKRWIAQMLRFVHLPGGKFGAEAGGHDDDVMAGAIANAMLHLTVRPKKVIRVRFG